MKRQKSKEYSLYEESIHIEDKENMIFPSYDFYHIFESILSIHYC